MSASNPPQAPIATTDGSTFPTRLAPTGSLGGPKTSSTHSRWAWVHWWRASAGSRLGQNGWTPRPSAVQRSPRTFAWSLPLTRGRKLARHASISPEPKTAIHFAAPPAKELLRQHLPNTWIYPRSLRSDATAFAPAMVRTPNTSGGPSEADQSTSRPHQGHINECCTLKLRSSSIFLLFLKKIPEF